MWVFVFICFVNRITMCCPGKKQLLSFMFFFVNSWTIIFTRNFGFFIIFWTQITTLHIFETMLFLFLAIRVKSVFSLWISIWTKRVKFILFFLIERHTIRIYIINSLFVVIFVIHFFIWRCYIVLVMFVFWIKMVSCSTNVPITIWMFSFWPWRRSLVDT